MGNAAPFEFRFTRNAKRAFGGTRGDDYRACGKIQVSAGDAEAYFCLRDAFDRIEREFDTGFIGLHLQHWAEFETGHAFGWTGEVVDPVDIDHLAAGSKHVDNDRACAMPGGGDGGIEPCHAGADDCDVIIVCHLQRQSSTETVVR